MYRNLNDMIVSINLGYARFGNIYHKTLYFVNKTTLRVEPAYICGFYSKRGSYYVLANCTGRKNDNKIKSLNIDDTVLFYREEDAKTYSERIRSEQKRFRKLPFQRKAFLTEKNHINSTTVEVLFSSATLGKMWHSIMYYVDEETRFVCSAYICGFYSEKGQNYVLVNSTGIDNGKNTIVINTEKTKIFSEITEAGDYAEKLKLTETYSQSNVSKRRFFRSSRKERKNQYVRNMQSDIFSNLTMRENVADAFHDAIAKGLQNPEDWMYVYSQNGTDFFKHHDTRKYVSYRQ